MTQSPWRDSLAAFFSERARHVGSVPTLQDLCFIAGRDPRIWLVDEVYQDLINSIVDALHLNSSSSVLEVGCASGFLANGVAPRVARYIGVDVAPATLKVAERLPLPNATFRLADGTRLPQVDGSVDAAFCYDVFTNFPRFEDGAAIIEQMLRVVKPGGRVLIGSVPDELTQQAYEARAVEVAADLERKFGPATRPPERSLTAMDKLRNFVRKPADPAIVCYYFRSEDFESLGQRLGVKVDITDIHQRNPYAGYRFNVVYTRPA